MHVGMLGWGLEKASKTFTVAQGIWGYHLQSPQQRLLILSWIHVAKALNLPLLFLSSKHLPYMKFINYAILTFSFLLSFSILPAIPSHSRRGFRVSVTGFSLISTAVITRDNLAIPENVTRATQAEHSNFNISFSYQHPIWKVMGCA